MEKYEIEEVAKILNEWNPLGDDAKTIEDLDGYRTEASDIIFNLKMEVLNQAFDLNLTKKECLGPTQKIINVLNKS